MRIRKRIDASGGIIRIQVAASRGISLRIIRFGIYDDHGSAIITGTKRAVVTIIGHSPVIGHSKWPTGIVTSAISNTIPGIRAIWSETVIIHLVVPAPVVPVHIIIIECRPAGAAICFHPQVSIAIILILSLLCWFLRGWFGFHIRWNFASRRIVDIIRRLTGFIHGGTTAKSSWSNYQK